MDYAREKEEEFRKVNFYEDFMREEGIPIIRGFFVEDLMKVELAPWKRIGGYGAYIDLEGAGGATGAYVCEIPGGQALVPQRHLVEEMIFILKGRGATSVWQDGSKQNFEWSEGSLFSIPLNAWFQHFNGEGNATTRFFAVTNAPVVMNLFHSYDFVFDNPFVFRDRFHEEADYFSGKGKHPAARVWISNFVADVKGFQADDWSVRGQGNKSIHFQLADSTMGAHAAEFPVGTYKKAHRHGPGFQILILSGQGYSLLWPEGKERVRVNWKPGSLFVPPNRWFHQHFNSGGNLARYLAFHWGVKKYHFLSALGSEGNDKDLKEGGDQIEYEDENHEIHQLFESELRQSGARCRMKSKVNWCSALE